MTKKNLLPKGWKEPKVSEVLKIVSGKTPKEINNLPNNGQYHFYKVSDMNKKGNEAEMTVANISLSLDTIKKLKLKLFPKGTVIFPKRGGAILTNKKRILSKESCFDLNLMGLIPNDNINYKFLYFWMQKLDLTKIYDGSTIPQINNKNIAHLSFPLPPLPEQQRIVNKLDALFARIDEAIQLVEANLELIPSLKMALLEKAFKGQLFGKVSLGKNGLPKGWKLKKLDSIIKVIGGGTPSRKNESYYTNGSIYWTTVKDMKEDILTNSQLKITQEAINNSSSNIIPKGNIIIATRVGLGKVCKLAIDTAINQDLKGLIPINKNDLEINFLFYWFKSIAKYIESQGTGATVKGVKVSFIKNLEIPLPPIKEQIKIIDTLDQLFNNLSLLKTENQSKLKHLQDLKKSLLEQAFQGKL